MEGQDTVEVLCGTRKEVTVRLWEEEMEKYVKRVNDSMECFRRFHEDSDAEHVMEDAEKLADVARRVRDVIYFMEVEKIQ